MKRKLIAATLVLVTLVISAFAPAANKLTSSKTHIKFFSTTVAEDIEAHNYKSVSTLDTQSGDVVFSVTMQSFEFEKALMQKHFNSDKFLDTQKNPKSKLIAKIVNLSDINFEKNGTYTAQIIGEMTINGKVNPFKEKVNVTVNGKALLVKTKFNITLANYNIAFEKGKPSTNIAKTVEVTVEAEY